MSSNKNLPSQSFRKKVYLTIDDAPSVDFYQKMKYLHHKKIPAVFFCIGQLLEERPEEIIESIHLGFTIANHSYTHPAFSKTSLEQCQGEIEKTDRIISQLYKKAGITQSSKWFRFPYGDKGDLKNGNVFSIWRRGDRKRKQFIQNILQNLGYTQPLFPAVHYRYMEKARLWEDIDWSWTFDIMEWALLEKKPTQGLRDIQQILNRIDQTAPKDCRGFLGFEKRWLASPSAEVLLLHDHLETSIHFETIIDKLLDLPLDFASFKNLTVTH